MNIAKFDGLAHHLIMIYSSWLLPFITLLAAMSPGPDFAVVSRYGLTGSFRLGFLSGLGVSTALIIHCVYCLLGVNFLFLRYPFLFTITKYLGAAYLMYIGICMLREKAVPQMDSGSISKKAFFSGFWCNLLNPKAMLFVLSLFTQFISPGNAAFAEFQISGIIFFTTLAWFTLLSFLITRDFFQVKVRHFQLLISRIMGVVLLLFAAFIVIFSE